MSQAYLNNGVSHLLRFSRPGTTYNYCVRSKSDLSGDAAVDRFALADRLFVEFELRAEETKARKERTAETDTSLEFFDSRLSVVFSSNEALANNLSSWLEDFFAIDVGVVDDPIFFYEWLYRYAGVSDVLFVDTASFSDESSLVRFVTAAHEICSETPIIGLCTDDDTKKFVSGSSFKFDVVLTVPVSLENLFIGMKSVADIILNGRKFSLVSG